MADFKFTMTDEAKIRMFNAFSQDGLLDVEIRRNKNQITIAALHEGQDIMTLGPLEIDEYGILKLEGLKLMLNEIN